MKFTFDKDLLPKHAKVDYVVASFPQMFIFVKEVDGVAEVCGCESLMGSLRQIPENVTYYEHLKEYTNTTHLKKAADESIAKGATHLITGIYDMLEDTFIESYQYPIEDDLEPFFIRVFNESLKEQSNAMFSREDILIANLKFADKHMTFQGESPELASVKLVEVYEFMKKQFLVNKTQGALGEGIIPFTGLDDIVFKHFDVKKDASVFFQFVMSLRGYDLGEAIFFNSANNTYDYFDGRLGVIDIQEIFKPNSELAKTVYPVGVYSKRFLAINDK